MTTYRPRVRRKSPPVPQTTPSFQELVDRYLLGITSRKEITRRVLVGVPNKSSIEVIESFNALETIALAEGWVTV